MAKKEGLKGPLWMKGDPLFRFWRQYEIDFEQVIEILGKDGNIYNFNQTQ